MDKKKLFRREKHTDILCNPHRLVNTCEEP